MESIRKAKFSDLAAVSAIYERIHDAEESGSSVVGWIRGIYPTAATAEKALRAGTLYVMEENGSIAAAAKIDGEQVPEYSGADWLCKNVPEDKVLVLHTLVVDPLRSGHGLGSRFVGFYEALAAEMGRPFLRMDTNVKNFAARRLYARLGYREAGIVSCDFNGIPDVRLVCLEKRLN